MPKDKKDKKKGNRIPLLLEKEPGSTFLNLKESKLLGHDKDDNKQIPDVNLRYYQTNYQCFSSWSSDELKDFTSFINKLSKVTWQDVYASGGGTGQKVSFGYTKHKNRDDLPNNGLQNTISQDIPFFELRINKKARVHGFRTKTSFFLVWLDRGHDICPM